MKKISIFLIFSLCVIGLIWFLENNGTITWRWGSVPQAVPVSETELKAVFLNIGQGDAALIKFPNAQTMLVDCGKDAAILAALGRNLPWHERNLDYLVVTHPHADHYAGCIDVLQNYRVGTIITNGYGGETNQLLSLFEQAIVAEQKIDNAVITTVSKPHTFEISSTTINFFYPDHDLSRDPRIPREKNLDTNDTSLVFKITFGNQDILLTGDMEKPLEKYLLQQKQNHLEAEILKIGHHGSDSSSSQEFLEVVRPKFCIISSGEGNSYGHPHGVTLRRLERMGCQVLRTDQSGDIIMAIDQQTSYLKNVQKF